MSAAPRPFRFAVNPHGAPSAAAWRDEARRAEDLGYSALLVPDHLNPQLAPIPALVAAAAVTTRLRLGPQVLNNDLRHPVVAAKEVASLDVLSDGRAEWGMGAGWLPVDYETTGIPQDPPGVRVARLAEALAIMKACFGGERIDHDGAHYSVHGTGSPAPVQRPHPPLLLGASHERMLRLGGREADTVSISPSWDARTIMGRPPLLGVEESIARQVGWVRDAAGPRADAVELSTTAFPATITDRPQEVVASAAPRHGLTPEEAARSPHLLVGSVAQVGELLEERRARFGLSHVVVPGPAAVAFAPVVARLAGT